MLLLSAVSLGASAQNGDSLSRQKVLGDIERFGRAILYINQNYIDTLNTSKMVDKAIEDVLSNLDPHSAFIAAKDVESVNEPLDGSFEGIGIEFAIINDTLTVQSPVQGGPCESVGILAGDKIIAVNDEYISGPALTNDRVFGYLRGAAGTKVNLKILRNRVSDTLQFTVVRGKIPLNSVDAAYLPIPQVVYIKLSRFAMNSTSEILKSLMLSKTYPAGVILDLRGNTGGFLHVALEISNMFLEKDQMILYTEGQNSPKREQYAIGNGIYKKGPLVILIDENSASSSEIVAGAMQDWDRAVIIGRRSFGKGLVQQMYQMDDGSQIRLTVARYHTPSGRVIQSPYENGRADDYYKSFLERYTKGESFVKDSIHFPDSLKYKTLIKGRTVYGGGGIMPDIFVPRDTAGITGYYAALIGRGYMTEYINNYCDSHRDSLKRAFPDFDKFKVNYNIGNQLYNGLLEYASGKGLELNAEQASASERLIKVRIKALVARSLFGTTGYYRVINIEDDKEFNKAMEVIINWSSIFPSL